MRAKKADSEIEIVVWDTGIGIASKNMNKIFEGFFRVDTPYSRLTEGTGLGLPLSKNLVELHNGTFSVESEGLNRGTKSGDETVLVAEDDVSLRKLMTIVLESFGYSVITAVDGEDAIAKFMENRKRISIVILDMIMPKKNGKEVGEAIREVSPGIKILFASGYTMDIIKGKELAADGSDFIHKPFTPKDLLSKVREILDR